MEKKLLKNEFDFYKWYFETCVNNESLLYPKEAESIPSKYPVIVLTAEDPDEHYYVNTFKYDFIYVSDFDTNLK
jgi:hypothetical protein